MSIENVGDRPLLPGEESSERPMPSLLRAVRNDCGVDKMRTLSTEGVMRRAG